MPVSRLAIGCLLIGIVGLSLGMPHARAEAYLQIVATGDSLTRGYSPNLLQNAMKAQGLAGNAYSVASGGATTRTYLGWVPDQTKSPPVSHNFALDAINGPVFGLGAPPVAVANPNADAIIVMIGTNDALQGAAAPIMVSEYQSNLTKIATIYQAAVTAQGKHPRVFFATVPPILSNPANPLYAQANAIIDDVVNPAIGQVATQFGFDLIDVNAAIQQTPNWQSFYSDDGVNPGYIHLELNGGYTWLANTMLNAVLATTGGPIGIGRDPPVQLPEPSSLALALGSALLVAAAARSRKRRAV